MRVKTNISWSQFQSVTPTVRDHSLACLGAGEYTGSNRRLNGRRLASHALVVVSEGSGWYVDNRHPEGRAVVAPALIWVFPGVEHGYGPGPRGWTEHWVLFAGRTTVAYEELRMWSRSMPVVELTERPVEALRLFEQLREAAAGVGERNQLRASILCQRVIELSTASIDGSGAADLVAEFASLAFTPLSVAERAARLGVSVNQLRVTIAEASGLTPLDYLVELRIARASELLVETGSSVSEVAASVGYEDPAYFSRLFAKRVGCAPTAFRAQQSRLVEASRLAETAPRRELTPPSVR